MIIDMPKRRPLNLCRETTRHGKVKWFHRAGHGPRTHLKPPYGTREFWAAYEAAERGEDQPTVTADKRMTIAWCILQYMSSTAWADLASESRKQITYQFQRIKDNAGDKDIRDVRRKHILEGQERRKHVPSDANKYVRAMGLLCRYCVDQEWLETSPVEKIGKLKTGSGFYTWQTNDFEAFESRWKLGSMQRLAYEIYLCTGLRRGDVHRFGRQHIKGNIYSLATSKTGMTVGSAILPRLASAIAATQCGDMTLLVSEKGVPFSTAASLGNWFGSACDAAGVPGNAHGIRKGLACILAEKGLTEAQLNAFFGWSHYSRESATYIEKAARSKMSRKGANVISRTFKKVRD